MRTDPLKNIATNEFDYNILMNCVKNYHFPRNKIGSLIKSGQIIRVKKGIYVKAGEDYNRLIVANMIYGPSYVSEDYALSYYGIIPERVETITCTTLARKRFFSTPLGVFEYNPTQRECYSFGIERVQIDAQRAYLIASPEKAIFDRLRTVDGLESVTYMREYLYENMRLSDLGRFNLRKLTQLAHLSRKLFLKNFIQLVKEESSAP